MDSTNVLDGKRILVVEDDYFMVAEVIERLKSSGAQVAGPFASMEDASSYISLGKTFDIAMLDVNVGGRMIFPFAETLQAQGIPLVFVTGYCEVDIPDSLRKVARFTKPVDCYSAWNIDPSLGEIGIQY